MNTVIELDRARHAVPQLYELLRTRIVSLELEPGASLSRPQLSAEFSISQTPVREALLKLAEERLVDVFPQSATRVSLVDVAHAQETHFLRRAVELELVRDLAIKRPAALLDHLDGLLARQAALRDAGDYGGFTEADQAFHHCMYEAEGKDDLWALVRSRSGHIDRLRRLHLPAAGKLNRIIADHTRIVAAMKAGDVAAAQDALRVHLSGTLEYVDTIRQAHPGYFKTR
jgi:DNA-binding GntR family transcriptional regulator